MFFHAFRPAIAPVLLALMALVTSYDVSAQPIPSDDLQLEPLRAWLKTNWYDSQFNDLGYNGARTQMYGLVEESGGQISCVYSGFQQASGFVTYPNPINAEHLVPQSFYGGISPMKSDIWSLKPCHGSANSSRSNDPFGEVSDASAQWYGLNASGEYTSQGTIPSNPDAWSERSGGLWEPRESVKGDVARAVFYFYTMYPTQAGTLSDVGDPATLYQWHLNDPVDAFELLRNDRVETAQGNRNPYIDHADWVYRVWFWEPPVDVLGCVNGSACNFDADATLDDGSCFFIGEPCDDNDANTFDDLTTSCDAPGFGCIGTPNPDPLPPIVWRENFDQLSIGLGCDGATGANTVDNSYGWTLACSPTDSALTTLWTEPLGAIPTSGTDTVLEFRGSGSMITWMTDPINIADGTNLMLSAAFSSSNSPGNYLEFAVLLDGAELYLIGFTGNSTGTPDDFIVDPLDLPAGASQIQIVLRLSNAGNGAWHAIDDITLYGDVPPGPGACQADLNGDGMVAVSDVLALLGQFGCTQDCTADITGDGIVTAMDMLAILAAFGSVCL